MLIHVDKKFVQRQATGKGRFSARLVQAWHDMGMQITDDAEIAADISYQVGRLYCPSKAKKHVLRVGPAAIDTNVDYEAINHDKAKSVKKADAVVYQSEYSKKIYHKLVCKPKIPEAVINNGANPKDYDVQPYESNFKINFLASTRVWTKQKRLKEIIKSFLLADIPDSILMVNGETNKVEEKYKDLDNVMFFGPVSDMVLARMYKLVAATGAYIHAVYVDACPNSLVEAQVAGCPAICTDQGGVPEILRYGTLIRDKPFKMKPENLDKPPALDRAAMARAMRYYGLKEGNIDSVFMQPDDLQIQNVAKKYLEFFREVL